MVRGEDFFELIPGARYYLWSPNSGLYLTYDWGGLVQDAFTGEPNQMFVFETVRVEEGELRDTYIYRMRALGARAQPSYVDIDGGIGEENGMAILITTNEEGENSWEWELRTQARGRAFDEAGITSPIFSVITNTVRTARVLDVEGVSKSPGARVHLWEGGTANNTKWFFELVSDVEAGNIVPVGANDDFDWDFFEDPIGPKD
jgi:hypothetical protein